MRKSGQRLRITAQLLDAITGNHIWSERYDRELTDIFALQDEITSSVAAAIEPKFLSAEAIRSQRRSPNDLDAWDLVTRALTHYWRMITADSTAAIDLLRQTVEGYPNFGVGIRSCGLDTRKGARFSTCGRLGPPSSPIGR